MHNQPTLTLPSDRLKRWKRDNALSFVPPDGKFILMEYRYAPPTSRSLPMPFAQIAVPFTLKPAVNLEEDGGTSDFDYGLRSTDEPFQHPLMSVFHRGCPHGCSTTWLWNSISAMDRQELTAPLPLGRAGASTLGHSESDGT